MLSIFSKWLRLLLHAQMMRVTRWLRLFDAHILRVMRWFLFYLPQIKTYLPQIKTSDRRVPLREKVIYSVISLLIYLVCSELPLYGVLSVPRELPLFNPLYWFRAMYAPNFGTVMDLGMLPVVFSKILMGSFPVFVDSYVLWNPVSVRVKKKLLAILISFFVASGCVLTGGYGSMDQLGMGNAILIVFQLCFAVIIVILLDELLQKGYGFGSGISLFSATNVCKNIIWNAFYQQNLHNVTSLLATVLIFLIVIYLQGFCVIVPLRSRKFKKEKKRKDHEQQPSYPIKLFYTSYAPIFILSAHVLAVHSFSQHQHINFSGDLFVDLLGKWKSTEFGGHPNYTPVGGIAYYITSPSSLADMAADPLHALYYLVFVLSTSAFSAIFWIYWSSSDSIAVIVKLRIQEQMIQSEQMTQSISRELCQYIPTAAAFGGMCIGALTVLANITGAVSSASEILVAVTTISEYLEAFEKERKLNSVDHLMQSYSVPYLVI